MNFICIWFSCHRVRLKFIKGFFWSLFFNKNQFLLNFQSLPLITSKSCDPTLVSQENIPYKNPYSTFFSKMTFWWLMPLLCKGFLRPLELSDLGNLSEKDTSRYHYDQFLFVYHANKVGSCFITSHFFLSVYSHERDITTYR